jgi:hypothetical protein
MDKATRISSLFTLFAAGTLSACAGSPGAAEEPLAQANEAIGTSICPSAIPPELTPAADQTIKASYTAAGVQIYICDATAAGGFAWNFVAPQANLLNDDGRMVGTHFIGPTWQANDGSSVSGKKHSGAIVDSSAVPWLLLDVTGHGSIDGRFSDVTAIQRLSTQGGVAPPATDCAGTSQLGSIVQVPYTAQYVLYKTRTNGHVKQCAAG